MSQTTMVHGTSPTARQYNVRLGLQLFAVYLLFYAGFVLINAFAAEWMEKTVIAGLNLAIVWGFGLIVVALILALIYGAMCRAEPSEAGASPPGDDVTLRDAATVGPTGDSSEGASH